MSTIDDAAAYFTSFFALEHRVLKANLEGATTFDTLHAELESTLADETVHSIPRKDVSTLTGEFKEANENAKTAIAPRQLFAVAQYAVGARSSARPPASLASHGRVRP